MRSMPLEGGLSGHDGGTIFWGEIGFHLSASPLQVIEMSFFLERLWGIIRLHLRVKRHVIW